MPTETIINAAYFAKQLSLYKDIRIDEFLKEEILPLFLRSGSRVFSMSLGRFRELLGKYEVDQSIRDDVILEALQVRGFHVRIDCDDRPCAESFIEIRIPPQET